MSHSYTLTLTMSRNPQIDDKQRDLLLHTERISELEQKLEKRSSDQNELEKRLRKEVETLQHRNCELETKLVDAASMVKKSYTQLLDTLHSFYNSCIHLGH